MSVLLKKSYIQEHTICHPQIALRSIENLVSDSQVSGYLRLRTAALSNLFVHKNSSLKPV